MINFKSAAIFFLVICAAGTAAQPVSFGDPVPETVVEAVDIISEMIPNNEVAIIRRTSEEEFAGNALFTLGAWMKEEWKLYSGESPLGRFFMSRGIYSADEMAVIILVCYWRKINQNSFDVEQVISEQLRAPE